METIDLKAFRQIYSYKYMNSLDPYESSPLVARLSRNISVYMHQHLLGEEFRVKL